MTDEESKRVADLEWQLKLVVLKLDEARRRLGLSSMVDEQLYAINSRKEDRRAEPN